MLSHALLRADKPLRAPAVSIDLFGGVAAQGDEHISGAPDPEADPVGIEEWQNRFVRNHARQAPEEAWYGQGVAGAPSPHGRT